MDLSFLTRTVIFLFSEDRIPLGTAFVVEYPLPDNSSQVVPLVVTAKHVVGDRVKVLGRFSRLDGQATAYVPYDLDGLRNRGDLWEHKDETVDIVVFRTPHYGEASYRRIPMGWIASEDIFEAEEIAEGDRVVFAALLQGFYGSAANYPVVIDATLALLPQEPIPLKYRVGNREIETKQRLILLSGHSFQGASGGPVFLWPGPRTKKGTLHVGGVVPYLIGLMHGFYCAPPREVQVGLTSPPSGLSGTDAARLAWQFAENAGIAIVFPSWLLLDILRSETLRARIRELVG